MGIILWEELGYLDYFQAKKNIHPSDDFTMVKNPSEIACGSQHSHSLLWSNAVPKSHLSNWSDKMINEDETQKQLMNHKNIIIAMSLCGIFILQRTVLMANKFKVLWTWIFHVNVIFSRVDRLILTLDLSEDAPRLMCNTIYRNSEILHALVLLLDAPKKWVSSLLDPSYATKTKAAKLFILVRNSSNINDEFP